MLVRKLTLYKRHLYSFWEGFVRDGIHARLNVNDFHLISAYTGCLNQADLQFHQNHHSRSKGCESDENAIFRKTTNYFFWYDLHNYVDLN